MLEVILNGAGHHRHRQCKAYTADGLLLSIDDCLSSRTWVSLIVWQSWVVEC